MYRVALILLAVTRVNSEVTSIKKSVFVSRKSRSNSVPLETGYVYSQVNNLPASFAMFGNDASDYNSYTLGHYSDYPWSGPPKYFEKKSVPTTYKTLEDTPGEVISLYAATPAPSYEYLKAKAETKFESRFLPSKLKSDAMYEKLKALMHYKEPDDGSMNFGSYDTLSDYHVDDDDVRSSSRISYDGWPYFYHTPYEYEIMKMESDSGKAKDKRYSGDRTKDVIPVHEDIDDIPNYYNQADLHTPRYNRRVITDNPIYGDQPFLSYVVNDYSNKNGDDDSLIFKGLDWGKDFDHEPKLSQVDDYLKRDRRLENSDNNFNNLQNAHNKLNHQQSELSKISIGDSTTERGYKKQNEFKKHEHGNGKNENHKLAYENASNNQNGFKDFVDTFTNKFGGEEIKKDALYTLNKNQDKGQNRKGFRRVYHKNEYQEEDEFYDNSNSSAKAVEKGGSALHHGGSEAILKSHAAAAIGNQANAFSNAGNIQNNAFENNHNGYGHDNGLNSEFNRYRDVAKQAAQSNHGDYYNDYRP